MGIRVTREQMDGTKDTTSYVCFGYLSSEDEALSGATLNKVHYHCSQSFATDTWRETGLNYGNELKELFKGSPMFRNFKFHERKGLVTVSNVQGMTADELLTGLFIVRNMSMRSDTIRTYTWLRERGYRPLVAMTFSHLYNRRDTLSDFDSESSRWTRHSQSEGSIFYQATFGKKALLQFIRQDYSKRKFFPWKQELFVVQHRYLRDRVISQQNSGFQHVLGTNGRLRDDGRLSDHSYYMASALSVNDRTETPLHERGVAHESNDSKMIKFIDGFVPSKYQATSPAPTNFKRNQRVAVSALGIAAGVAAGTGRVNQVNRQSHISVAIGGRSLSEFLLPEYFELVS